MSSVGITEIINAIHRTALARKFNFSCDGPIAKGKSTTIVIMKAIVFIKSLNDLADLSSDELKEILGNNEMSLEDANKVIMAARAHWFEKES